MCRVACYSHERPGRKKALGVRMQDCQPVLVLDAIGPPHNWVLGRKDSRPKMHTQAHEYLCPPRPSARDSVRSLAATVPLRTAERGGSGAESSQQAQVAAGQRQRKTRTRHRTAPSQRESVRSSLGSRATRDRSSPFRVFGPSHLGAFRDGMCKLTSAATFPRRIVVWQP